jgi:hypothetical protein
MATTTTYKEWKKTMLEKRIFRVASTRIEISVLLKCHHYSNENWLDIFSQVLQNLLRVWKGRLITTGPQMFWAAWLRVTKC